MFDKIRIGNLILEVILLISSIVEHANTTERASAFGKPRIDKLTNSTVNGLYEELGLSAAVWAVLGKTSFCDGKLGREESLLRRSERRRRLYLIEHEQGNEASE